MANLGEKERIQWIDIAKAVGIFLVVACHNPYVIFHLVEVSRAVLSFHVPFFFAITGITLKAETPLKTVMLRSASLLWVYFTVAALSLPLVLVSKVRNDWNLTDVLAGIAYGTGHNMHPVPLWFLVSLSTSLIPAWMLLRLAKRLGRDSEKGTALAAGILGILIATLGAFWIDWQPYDTKQTIRWGTWLGSGAFWNIDLLPLATGFVLLGHALSRVFLIWKGLQKSRWAAVAWVGVFAILYSYFLPVTDLYQRHITPPLASVMVACTGVIAMFAICISLRHSPRVVTAIGAATLPILAAHQFIQKKIILLMDGSLPAANPVSFAVSILFAIGIPVILNELLFRRSLIGSLIFYPRKLVSSPR
jgi:fucose 4-O-acetylase-like acetyltransferase